MKIITSDESAHDSFFYNLPLVSVLSLRPSDELVVAVHAQFALDEAF